MPKSGFKVDGNKIQNLRKNMGFSQTELGEKAMLDKGMKKISLRTIQKIENDTDYLCSLRMINNLGKVFGIPPEGLLFETNFSIQEGSILNKDEITKKIENYKPQHIHSKQSFNSGDQNSEINKKIEIDSSRKFVITEDSIGKIFKHLAENDDDRRPWHDDDDSYSPPKYNQIADHLRNFKLIPTSFGDLSEGIEGLDENIFKILCDHAEPGGFNTDGCFEPQFFVEHPFEQETDTFHRFNRDDDAFFRELSTCHFYSIDYDLPEEKDILEKMCELIENIETHLSKKTTIAENLKFRFHFVSLRKELIEKNMSIFFSTATSRTIGMGKNYDHAILTARHMRILFKYWKNRDVIDKYNCHDVPLNMLQNWEKVEWRYYHESDQANSNRDSDESERVRQLSLKAGAKNEYLQIN